jgi:hypothetical protein
VPSRPCCVALYGSTLLYFNESNFAVQQSKANLSLFRDRGFYRELADDKDRPFRSWEAFVRLREPFGLGLHPDVGEAILREKDGRRLIGDIKREALARAAAEAKPLHPQGTN